MNVWTYIIFSIIVIQFIVFYILRYKFHWIYGSNREEREDAKIRQKFIFGKDVTLEDNLQELFDKRKERKKKSLLKNRKQKLDKIFKRQK